MRNMLVARRGRRSALISVAALAATGLVASMGPANAAITQGGGVNDQEVPSFYKDANGVALQLCVDANEVRCEPPHAVARARRARTGRSPSSRRCGTGIRRSRPRSPSQPPTSVPMNVSSPLVAGAIAPPKNRHARAWPGHPGIVAASWMAGTSPAMTMLGGSWLSRGWRASGCCAARGRGARRCASFLRAAPGR